MPHRSILVRAGFAASAAVLLAHASSARAETARSVTQAAGACRLGRWSAAAQLLREVDRQQRRPEDWLCLARAQFHTGQWVAALDSYDELMESSSPRCRAAQAAGAVERRELEQRLGWLQIVTSAALSASVSLRLDGEAIPPSRVGVAFPVQPGTHALSIEVGGEVRQVGHWRIAQGEHRSIGLSIPTELPPAQASPDRAVAPSEAVPRQPKQNQSVSSFRPKPSAVERWAKRLVIGGGIAGGAGFVLLAASGGSRGVAYAGLGSSVLGGVSLMTGASLYVANEIAQPEPSDAPPEPARRLQVQTWILSDGAGTAVSGSF
jgi:hypothetical protein